MRNPFDESMWLQEKALQDQIQTHALEQELFGLSARSRFGFNLPQEEYIFSNYGNLQKRHKFIWKIKNMDYGLRTKLLFCKFFLMNF